ncbi:UNVERIFIED_ORG: EAL domain-containing protein (putative c-di-GMP-specific phosphodiesterase class I)/GGDEF domain-containing protein [Kosakonia oryzae]|uniref:EAL domain, c-di-GMP-specific phosphodiesterase class I (Or its enzymatically inactive variant) n=1 Tax=Kosakonia radicincitans TaxID=283686 RepID=A0AAX2EU71_9ENTR|nr:MULTISPECIES: biofilm formation regulator HmsP [Kosakonia]MDP9567718.1 EAL domain-containing protein (putative c-di-GMP-specific phosphodiesterase class I)/GGDEF domain-containing protein [Kosakonia oryzae]SFE97739.1 EAL domain, c-di-GMP-specific phosphodiesterase class I (or its enzymatically inactive variant) [Kosakonia radicincitans]SFR18965.1 EAL domain, c-di-GMP-specific phosphodiesterase class I (or its enzymatically inactive variant) [Kosakonia radicincitans]SFT82879.1 EAL domain, c-d
MRVSRSLTIKQMAMVACVSMVFVFIFCVILLFHFLQQNRYNTATQLESIARSVREPLSAAILKADIPEAETILKQIKPAGVVSRADVVLPNQFQALRVRFIAEHPVPITITRFFELPIQITLPIYSLERPANPQPLAYLVLQADSWRTYKFILSTLSMLVTTYLLLSLMITVAITWCINRLIVHPLRKLSAELNALSAQESIGHQLTLPGHHFDDEIGVLVRNYNRNQQMLLRQLEEMNIQSTRFPVSELPNKAFLMAMLEQTVARQKPTALMIVSCETLRDTAGVLQESQREVLLVTLVEKLKSVLSPHMMLAQVSGYDFAIIANGVQEPWHAMTLGKQALTVINERVPLNGIQLRPNANIGVAMFYGDLSAGQIYHRAMSAVTSAQRKGKNQIQFFDPEQMELAQQRLTQESDILTALDQGEFALWLQPQVAIDSGELVSAEALLRVRQPDGSWDLPQGLIERIESCGLMVTVGYWVLEEACRLLAAWQSRGIMLPLSVNLSAIQLLHHDMVPDMLALLNRYRIAPQTMILEVTESRHIDDPKAAVEILRPLRNAGVRIALDDFGMGYAGLSQLHHMKSLPVDMLKIDKMFVEGLPEDDSMVSAIIHLARSLELHIIAEGVETQAQREWLVAAGVEVAQGFLFDRATSADQFEHRYLAASERVEKS